MIQTFPGSSGPCAQNLYGHVRMIRPYLGSSGLDSFGIYRLTAGCPNPLFIFSTSATLFLPKNLVRRFGVSAGISSWFLVPLILHVLEDPDTSGTPLIHVGISKVFHSKSPRPDLSM